MAARRTIKAINWAPLVERIHESEKAALAALKAKSDQYFRRVSENPESLPKIDWAQYKKYVSPALVDKFQKEYESLKIEYPADKYTSLIEAQEQEATTVVQKFIQESNSRISEFEAKINKLKGLMQYKNMTMEDFARAHPDMALDQINRPTIWPHEEEFQPNPDADKNIAHH
ncbi:ATP synthase subunit d, mitochondrial-like [Phymastichus coffea]|uniref:ATP synthase subunit d, mitochondrial-like n=1 Tax=Phymastichus coffea TaxID=108790 RepID=UPI00273BB573|nr:ATP synthase subunit d, mitochondrial-like [Phymastichus coffea]